MSIGRKIKVKYLYCNVSSGQKRHEIVSESGRRSKVTQETFVGGWVDVLGSSFDKTASFKTPRKTISGTTQKAETYRYAIGMGGKQNTLAHREGRTRSLQIITNLSRVFSKSLTLYPIELGGHCLFG
ncbi:hypothetical protein EW146_g2108 [Bondarzewia mesenterica]|uniref:Uncharacterized protein n=1 Tax=Bondarzewia mesenterica TaxID=1095465 RepID=A0A4S4M7X5_9AGAM|nr:hypothetical protein EW146_g2108 [Bondarzewia mesenterica]